MLASEHDDINVAHVSCTHASFIGASMMHKRHDASQARFMQRAFGETHRTNARRGSNNTSRWIGRRERQGLRLRRSQQRRRRKRCWASRTSMAVRTLARVDANRDRSRSRCTNRFLKNFKGWTERQADCVYRHGLSLREVLTRDKQLANQGELNMGKT